MKKEKSEKILIIVSLLVAIITLGVGFAAFSNTLTISSSATVTPNKDDFKMKVYGLETDVNIWDYAFTSMGDDSLFTSSTSAKPFLDSPEIGSVMPKDYTIASIDNDKLTIGNIAVTFSEPNQSISYPLVIRNEGKYDAYLNTDAIKEYVDGVLPSKCVADEGTTVELVDAACQGIKFSVIIVDSAGETSILTEDVSSWKIDKGDYVVAFVSIAYFNNSARADGPFNVEFADVKLDFSTVA